eukprot:g10831.t1
MPEYKYEERVILKDFGALIFNMVCDRATPKQWAEWLQVPLEHAAGTGNADLVNGLLKAGAVVRAGGKGAMARHFFTRLLKEEASRRGEAKVEITMGGARRAGVGGAESTARGRRTEPEGPGGGGGGGFDGVVARVMALEEDGVFRKIVGFL